MTITELFIKLRYKTECFLSPFRITFKKQFKYDITFVLIIRDEAEYLKEWIDYHSLLFSDKKIHFYIIDNKSTDNLKEIIKEYRTQKIVTYQYANSEMHPQVDFYTHAIYKYFNKSKLMAFIDTDEFIIPSNYNFNVYNYITSKVDIGGGFSINWLCFGSSNHKVKPKGSVLESYLYRSDFSYKANSHVKTIINPRKVRYYKNPHNAVFKKGCFSVNEENEIVSGAFNENRKYEYLRLHHYASKSLEEQQIKINRGYGKKSDLNKMNIKHNPHDINDIFDTTAVQIVKNLQNGISK